MSKAAEQLDENNALKEECASLQSAVGRPESDEAGGLSLGLERRWISWTSNRPD